MIYYLTVIYQTNYYSLLTKGLKDMRKLRVTRIGSQCLYVFALLSMLLLSANHLTAQCSPSPGTIGGTIFIDSDIDGINSNHAGASSILISIFDENGAFLKQTMSNIFGQYEFSGLKDHAKYRIEFKHDDQYYSTVYGDNSKSSVQWVQAPSCTANFGVIEKSSLYDNTTDVGITCFVQGDNDANGDMETIVYLNCEFQSNTAVGKIADKNATGAVWGLAYKSDTKEMFSSAFVKQYAALINGHDAIFKTDIVTGTTSLFTNLSTLGIYSGSLSNTAVETCDYGNQVGTIGLGGLEISSDLQKLYVVNILNKSVVELSATNPTPSTTKEYIITDADCGIDKNYYPFALKYFEGKIYVGTTCIKSGSTDNSDSNIKVYELDFETGQFTSIFETDYNKGNWLNTPADNIVTDHWLTDIDFTDEGNMIIGLTDRTGHRFCDAPNRLDQQYPDILMVWNNNGTWTLESNGVAGSLVGSGADNNEGPGGGEFFGHDFYPGNPTYHNEVALGSFTVIPGSGYVIAAVFDPESNTYSGGMHRYRTINGKKIGSKELYTNDIFSQFGKATGLGEVEPMIALKGIEIGNVVWFDENSNGVQDPNESGIPNVNVSIFNSSFEKIGTTATNSEGHYVFNNTNVDSNKDGQTDKLTPFTTYYLAVDSYDTNLNALVHDNQSLVLTSVNTGVHTSPYINDNDASIATNLNSAIDGLPFIKLTTGSDSENNHTHDFGFLKLEGFDLALRKEVVGNDIVQVGDEVTYKITVFNQGLVGAKNITIVDYIPNAMKLAATGNAGWTVANGVASYTIEEQLEPNETKDVFITLFINEGLSYDEFINYAEISSAEDQFGQNGQDIDSNADADATNDAGGVPFQNTDNQVDDDGTVDEDDHDVAMVRIFDLALIKKIVNVKNSYIVGDVVEFEITVFNQGNVDAKDVEIVDYNSEAYSLASATTLWNVNNNGNFVYTIPAIPAGESVTVKIDLTLNNIKDDKAINTAEILSAFTDSGEVGLDIDSTPNENPNDDKGGKLYHITNNMITDNGTIDEDDHDRSSIPFDVLDLALMKMVSKKVVKQEDVVVFEIEVINQGTVPVKAIQLVDYLPEHLTVDDNNWFEDPVDPSRYYTVLSIENNKLKPGGLKPGEHISVTIKTIVNADAPMGQIMNYAEISYIEGMDGSNNSLMDIDSDSDSDNTNDVGAIPNSFTDNYVYGDQDLDEDDHDVAAILVADLLFNASCTCLSNASSPGNGQFYNAIRLASGAGEDWRISDLDGVTQGLNPLGTAPDFSDYTIGTQVMTSAFDPSASLLETSAGIYEFEFILSDGVIGNIVLSNGTDTIPVENIACSYNPQVITGPKKVCAGNTEEYCVPLDPNSTYQWTLSGGGAIVGSSTSNCITVEWTDVPGTEHVLTITEINAAQCKDFGSVTVQLGAPTGGQVACLGDINLSLGNTCEIEITPELVLKHSIPEHVLYDIILVDANGNMFPDNIVNDSHIGQPIMIKAVDVCTGNSCWSTLVVEDKIPPVFTSGDTTLLCSNIASLEIPKAVDACGGEVIVTPLGLNEEKLTCDPDYTTKITRVYEATDKYGNTSEPFTQVVYLERILVDGIVDPPHRALANNDPLYCGQFPTVGDGVPDPEFVGVPTYQGLPLFPYNDQYCNFGIMYTDSDPVVVNCATKIFRTWTMIEWHCDTSATRMFKQVINIVDKEDPEFDAPANIQVTANVSTCDAQVQLPPVSPTDDCSTTFEVDIQYPNGFLNNQNGGVITLPLGSHLITYTVSDGCGKSTSKNMVVTVLDQTAPVMVCDKYSAVSLNKDGKAFVPALTFDDGSIDDCTNYTLEVKRMDNGSNCAVNNYLFGDVVEFCCADVGKETMVMLKATDENGNSNTCMVVVDVQDKNPPQIVVPNDTIIDCTVPYDLTNLGVQFGTATATDNCMNTTISESVATSFVPGCQIGTITRTFVANDGNGTATDQQTITIVNSNPFNFNTIDWPNDLTVNITSPNCANGVLEPEDLSYPYNVPTYDVIGCNVISSGHTDQIFEVDPSNQSCYKILRTWMVMDECAFNQDGTNKMVMHQQTIVVENTMKPEIISSCAPIDHCVYGTCDKGFIELTATAQDDCTENDAMEWEYRIDLNDDNTFDIINNGVGNTITVADSFILGNHSIRYKFTDKCGNSEVCTQKFTLENCDVPTAYCKSITAELTPMDLNGDGVLDAEMTTVNASQLDNNSFHICGLPVVAAFDSLGIVQDTVFDCDDIGVQQVTVYIVASNGTFSTCTATVEVQDNNNESICPEYEECIIWPEPSILIAECVSNLDPITINSQAMVSDTCFCMDYDITFVDVVNSTPGDACEVVTRTWTIDFNCGGGTTSYSFVQTITQQNAYAPVITSCPSDITATATTEDCEVAITVPVPTFDASCSFGVSITNDSPYSNSNIGAATGNYPMGPTVVTYTITDQCGNASTCSLTITIEDGVPPMCKPKDITVTLGSTSPITIAEDAVDDGSQDVCSNGPLTYDTDITTFDCSNLGNNPVVLTVTDQSNNSSTCTAVVTVVDTVAPVCNLQPLGFVITSSTALPITITANDIDNGSFDPCGNIVSRIVNPNSFDCTTLGDNEVTMTITDNNGNVTTCTTTITITETIAPECVPNDITINIEMDGTTVVTGDQVAGGSFDPCGAINTIDVLPNSFTCDDIANSPITVDITVTDNYGNTSECTAEVTVESADSLTCDAQDLTVYLDETGQVTITPEEVGGGSMVPCGDSIELSLNKTNFFCNDAQQNPNIVTLTVTNATTNEMISCPAEITVLDTLAPTVICPAEVTFSCDTVITYDEMFAMPTIDDNCSNNLTINQTTVDNRSDCGVGTVSRTYEVTDLSGNVNSCTSVAVFESGTTVFAETDITWPVTPLTLDDCTSTDPVVINSFPIYNANDFPCSNISSSFVDSGTAGSCMDTFFRDWTVVDSCQLDGTGTGVFNFQQMIIVNDSTPPVITPPTNLTFYVGETNCVAAADLSNVSIADCNSIVAQSNNSPHSNNPNTVDASGVYPLGNYNITLSATDACGQTGTETFTVQVLDTIKPVLQCFKFEPIIGADQTVTVTPNDFIVSVSDNCTAFNDLNIVFIENFDENDPNPFDNGMFNTFTYNCSDVGAQNQLAVFVYDESMNWSVCVTLVVVMDPEGNCPSPNGVVAGEIATDDNTAISGTSVILSNGAEELYTETDSEGNYIFNNVPYGDYYVQASNNKHLLAGVDVLDVLAIQKHVLGIELLDTPFKLLAADVNNSGGITNMDAMDLQKALLGIKKEFPNNESFRFLAEDHVFVDSENPFMDEINEVVSLEKVTGKVKQNFKAVKVGDVNGSYVDVGNQDGPDTPIGTFNGRSAKHKLYTNRFSTNKGFITSIPVRTEAFKDLIGLQASIIGTDLEIISVTNGKLDVDQVHVVQDNNVEMDVIWVGNASIDLESDDILFEIQVKVVGDNPALSLKEDAKQYMVNTTNDVYGIVLNDEIQQLADEPAVYQNIPNPWNTSSVIPYYLNVAQDVAFTFYNMDGQILMTKEVSGVRGMNELQIRSFELKQTGVITYEMRVGDRSFYGRMIKIK